jgi:acetyl esterase/lipase
MDITTRMDATHLEVLAMLPEGLLDLSDLHAARAGIDALMAAAPAPDLPPGLVVEDHLVEGFDGHQVLVRVYRPGAPRQDSPALYWIHGGGMVLGDVSMDDTKCAQIADQLNVVVASVDYRLAPEFPFPVPMEDCYSGLVWFFEAATKLGIDPSRIAIGGASSGGGLAAGLALLARDREQVSPCFQLLIYPMIDDRDQTPSSAEITDTRVWNQDANVIAWNAYLDGGAGGADVPIYAAPSRAEDLSGLPPAIITVGDLDLFLDEDIAYAQALLGAGVSTELHVYAGAFHGSNNFVAHSELSMRWNRGEMEALGVALNG